MLGSGQPWCAQKPLGPFNAQVEKHNSRTDAWIVLNGQALDVTMLGQILVGSRQGLLLVIISRVEMIGV